MLLTPGERLDDPAFKTPRRESWDDPGFTKYFHESLRGAVVEGFE
jgi:hypothetical protein